MYIFPSSTTVGLQKRLTGSWCSDGQTLALFFLSKCFSWMLFLMDMLDQKDFRNVPFIISVKFARVFSWNANKSLTIFKTNVSYIKWKVTNCGRYGFCLADSTAQFCPVFCPVHNWDISNNNGCDFPSKQSAALTGEARCNTALKPLFWPLEFTCTARSVISHFSP